MVISILGYWNYYNVPCHCHLQTTRESLAQYCLSLRSKFHQEHGYFADIHSSLRQVDTCSRHPVKSLFQMIGMCNSSDTYRKVRDDVPFPRWFCIAQINMSGICLLREAIWLRWSILASSGSGLITKRVQSFSRSITDGIRNRSPSLKISCGKLLTGEQPWLLFPPALFQSSLHRRGNRLASCFATYNRHFRLTT